MLQGDLRAVSVELEQIIRDVETATNAIPERGLLFEDLRSRYDEPAKKLREELASLKTWAVELRDRAESKRANVLLENSNEVSEAPVVDSRELFNLRQEHNERVARHDELVQSAAKAVEVHYLKKAESEVNGLVKAANDAATSVSDLNAELTELNSTIVSLDTIEGDPTPSARVLTREVARLLGRDELRFEAVDGKYKVTRDGEPAIGLSAGEVTAITLVHFLEAVARFDASGGEPIVIIDDPVSSLDSEIFMGVSTYIWSEAVSKEHISQLFLLTHNFELFRQWDIQIEGLHRGKGMKEKFPAQFYELKSQHETRAGRIKRTPVIAAWPPNAAVRKKVRSSYHHAFIATVEKLIDLQEDDSIENRLNAQLLFPNVIRRMLETFLAFKRPDWVGDFTSSMREATQLLVESDYQGDADALRLRLTRYTHASSHSESPSTDTTVSPDEVKTAIEAVFDFMNQIDHQHFVGLCSVTRVEPTLILPITPTNTGEEDIVNEA